MLKDSGRPVKNNPIRVAQVVGRVVTGGVDAVVMNYYRHIDRDKVQFDFIMDGYDVTPIDNEIKRLGGRVYKVEPYARNMLKNMKDCYRIFKTNHYDIVHSNLNTLSVFPLMMAWLAGVKIRIAHNHSTAAKDERKTILKYMLRPFAKLFATHYFACSKVAGEWLFGIKCMQKGNITIINNAIDAEKYLYNVDTRIRVRKRLNLNGKFVVGHVGRFVYQKNHEFLIEIFNEILKKNHHVVLLLVGTGELEPHIKEKVNLLGISSSVRFLGMRHDVPELLQAMDAFLLPSFYEGLPVVGVEAQTAGLPCLFSDAVTREVKISENVEFIGIDKPAEIWAQKTLTYANGYTRRKYDEKERQGCFDIVQEAAKLADLYLQIVNTSASNSN